MCALKTLYVADLDGTLLDRSGMLSSYTIGVIRRMTDGGIPFTIATARSLQAANDLIWHLGLRLPSILANGAMIYSSVEGKFLSAATMSPCSVQLILDILERHESCGFFYALEQAGCRTTVYYHRLLREWDEVYCSYRLGLRDNRVVQVDDLLETARRHRPFYIVVCGQLEVLTLIQQELQPIHAVTTELYLNGYTNFYFMDIFPSSSSKAEGLLSLQQITGAQELVAFGDNFTDIPMLLVADRAYVPRNGVAAARGIATEVLGYAYQDSVAHFLSREMGWER